MNGLPAWAVVGPARRAHSERVVALVTDWAERLQLSAAERERWVAAAWLHDALRDETPARLRSSDLPSEFHDWPDLLLHGPAAAARLRAGGFADEGILRALTYHTVGHPDLDAAGRALYLADFLEPGRTFDPIGRAVMRARMPHERDAILRDVLRNRLAHMLASGRKIRGETLAFWNHVVR
ncbi:MAG: HD domain-containing protein [Gemmatimonadota bacterium]